MTQRKPPAVPWESWIDRQVRRAQQRGEFRRLPGAGKPIPDLDKPFDELRWVKDKLAREELSYMSPSVALRKQVHDAVQAAGRAESEAEVRQLIAEINKKIRDANRQGIRGPSLMLMPIDPDSVVGDWRRRRSEPEQHVTGKEGHRGPKRPPEAVAGGGRSRCRSFPTAKGSKLAR